MVFNIYLPLLVINLYCVNPIDFRFFSLFKCNKKCEKIIFAMMRHYIFLMRFTPEEREIVLEMAKNCLSKHNLTFFFLSLTIVLSFCKVCKRTGTYS